VFALRGGEVKYTTIRPVTEAQLTSELHAIGGT
jgi:hypothetical protein